MHGAGVPEKRKHYVFHGSYFADGPPCCAPQGLAGCEIKHETEDKDEKKGTDEEEMCFPLREKFSPIHDRTSYSVISD